MIRQRVNDMNKLNVFSVLFIALFSSNVFADEVHFLTVKEIVEDGYVQLSGLQIVEIMNKHIIKVVDIETDSVITSKNDSLNNTIDRKFVDEQKDKSSVILDPRLMARAPPLDGKLERRVVGDELVVTDGIRTYHYSLYRKQERIFAVRDIDHGNVFLEVKYK